jgi:predicted methyltransferase
LLVSAFALAASHAWAADTPAYIRSAVSDAGRPAADKARDTLRKPAELLAFFQIKPGRKLAELLPGTGYFTRIFSKAVGTNGKVYVLGPPGAAPTVTGVTGAGSYANVAAIAPSATSLNLPERVDMVWTSLNYHDLKNPPPVGRASVDIAAFNKAIYQALKPGGYYVVIDHAANKGDAGASADKHRIDQLTVVQEIAAAGFILQAETQALRHPEDPRTAPVFALDGATDQFAMLFRKPDLSMGGAIRDPQE